MTILSGQDIAARLGLLEPMELQQGRAHGTSYGLGYAGYDLRLDSMLDPDGREQRWHDLDLEPGQFVLGSTIERFRMPNDLLAIAHDKSTLARLGLSVFNTVIEPGWEGYLTLELVNKGPNPIRLHRGMGIAQVVFHVLSSPARPYVGKYQNQEAGPQVSRPS